MRVEWRRVYARVSTDRQHEGTLAEGPRIFRRSNTRRVGHVEEGGHRASNFGTLPQSTVSANFRPKGTFPVFRGAVPERTNQWRYRKRDGRGAAMVRSMGASIAILHHHPDRRHHPPGCHRRGESMVETDRVGPNPKMSNPRGTHWIQATRQKF